MPAAKAVPALLGGLYKPPRYKLGKPVYDLLHGDLTVVGISDTPIPWPLVKTAPTAAGPVPAVTAELARAVKTESVEAIVHHWGASRWTVRRWRVALGVPRFNLGTQQLWRDLAPQRLDGHRAGGNHPKLSADRRAELVRRARAGEPGAALAVEFGVSRQYVGQLRSRTD